MNAHPKEEPADLDVAGETDQQIFPLLNECWEALRQQDVLDYLEGVSEHSNSPIGLPNVRALAALNVARRVLNEDTQPPGPDEKLTATTGTGRPLLEPGTLLGECRIQGLLGYGGMGEVYLAEHEVLKRPVAIKVLPADLAQDAEAVARFRKSVELLARLNHPAIAAAHHASTYQGRLYLVMEYVPGLDLKNRVRQQGPLPLKETCTLIREAALGLDYAHQQDIIHRDIKPANLMLTPEGAVKILDLGLARLNSPEARDGEHSQTHPGALMGTLDFIAPEQAQDARQADARSDLYSLGCTFYYLLTGRPPFAKRSPLEKALAHALEKPRPVEELRPDVSPAVAAVVHRLLAKRPEDRYATAAELAAALEPFTQNADLARPVQATAAQVRFPNEPTDDASGSARPLQWGPKRRWGAVAVLAGIVLLALAVFWGRGMFGAAEPVRIDALEVQRYHGERIVRFVNTIGSPPTLSAHRDEAVRVHVHLNRPAYCYLIAYNPDGQEQLCYPEKSTIAPQPIKEYVYPAGEKEVFRFREEAIGLQAFILVASGKPLPPYARWKAEAGDCPWKPLAGESVWSYDGQRFSSLGSDRGQVEDFPDLPKPFEGVCNYLKNQANVESIRGLAFPVRQGPAKVNP